ncbi:MAG: TldD/PmbA family protein, partial [Acidimicrobiales bacterium]
MIPAQELVERGVAAADAAGGDACIVLVEEGSHADVRFAQNTTTTNGVHRARSVSVVMMAAGSVGTSRRTGVVGTAGVDDMVAAALADAREAPPAEDAFPLVESWGGTLGRDFGLAPEETDSGVLESVLSSLSGAFGRARARDAVLAGFAELDVTTLYLGSSTGLRLSHLQPTGAVNLVGRTTDGKGSAWVGEPSITPSLEDMEREIWRRLDWAKRQVSLEAGRYEVILPPSGVGDMMAELA